MDFCFAVFPIGHKMVKKFDFEVARVQGNLKIHLSTRQPF